MVDFPKQMIFSPPIDGLGKGLTVTVTLDVDEHPLLSVTVTVYIVVAKGLTTILDEVFALFQR